MSDRLPPCPQPPDWQVSWDTLDAAYGWVRNLKGCPQDPVRHAEGDVWIHVRMVCTEMAALPAWRDLPPDDRRVVFAAALLHDVAKPACTRLDPDGRLSARGHAWRGAIMARRILWRLGVPFEPRERVCALVRHHLVPLYLLEREDSRRHAIEVSQTARCDHLGILSEADARGRICPDPQRLLDNIALFRSFCTELGVSSGPMAFPSDHARFLYFRDPARQPDTPAYEEFTCDVVLMSGLPGAGKDHWLKTNLPGWPVVSLDAVRAELGVAPGEPQGPVLARARELARGHLREKQSFAWNATNLSRQVRSECVRLFADYGARVRLVYVEAPPEKLYLQNRQRRGRVPEGVIERLLDRWEVPDLTEAHQVEWAVSP
jgi:predicted kinase